MKRSRIARFHELTQSPEQVDTSQTLGKMIEGFTWYLAAEVPAEQARAFERGAEPARQLYTGDD